MKDNVTHQGATPVLTQRDEVAWEAALATARTAWPDERLDELVARTVAEITRTVAGRKAAFAWTGAKDSLVLGHLAGMAGVKRCVLAITSMEYPGFLRWVTENMPDGLAIVSTGQDLEWLRYNPLMLFPQHAYGPHWHKLVQHRGQVQHYQDKSLGMLLVPERRGIGPCRQLTSQDGAGVVRYTPLADWTREAMVSLIQREAIALPPCYGWPRGLEVGPGPWPARQGTRCTDHGFDEVWSIDPDLVREAAPHLPQAAQWLATTGRS